MFIKIGSENNETSIENILKFIDHHNNWTNYFNETEIRNMEEEDTIPGEFLNVIYIVREDNDKKEYWANIGNGGGSDWTEAWANSYFPNIKIYNSSDWDYYDCNWINWPKITLSELKNDFSI